MAMWRNFISFMTGAGQRQIGTQSGAPGSYAHRAATPVTLDTAMQLSAVWACGKLYADTIGSLPCNMYEKKSNGELALVKTHNIAMLLNGKMNRWQTRQEFFESIIYQQVYQGNNYSAVQRNGQGDAVAIVPLMTDQMTVILEDSGNINYQYTDSKGTKDYTDKVIWHNKNMGNGIIGLSTLAYARNSIGVGQAAENSVSKIYGNGGKPSGLLTIDRILKPEQRTQIKKNFAEMTEGTDDRLFVLEADMKYAQVSLSPQDIELLQSRRFQIEDIARFFGVPSVLINDTQSTTAWGSGVQQIIQGFYKVGVRPYLTRYQDSMRCNLLKPEERDKFVFKFELDDLLQPEFSERITTGKEAVTGALLTPNEWRESEGYPPIDGGDKLYMQQQMTPLDELEGLVRGVKNATTPKAE